MLFLNIEGFLVVFLIPVRDNHNFDLLLNYQLYVCLILSVK